MLEGLVLSLLMECKLISMLHHAAHEDGYGHSGGVIMVGGTAIECIT